MNTLVVVGIAMATSLLVSSTLVAALIGPLRALLARLCTGPETERFWVRFAIVMLYLAPLLIALVFGVPVSAERTSIAAGQIVRQVLSAALFGAFLALAAIGLRLSTLATRGAVSAPTDPRNWTARS